MAPCSTGTPRRCSALHTATGRMPHHASICVSSEPDAPLDEERHGELVEESYPCLRYAVRPSWCHGRIGAGKTTLRAAVWTSCSSLLLLASGSPSATSASGRPRACV